MVWEIEYPYKTVEKFILELPPGLQAKYFRLADSLEKFGANLGMPRTRAMSDGLFELRVQGKEGIARVFCCTLTGKRIVVLHGFVKKTQKTPQKELKIAQRRLKEIKSDGP
ncbi:MAG: type II toxin-antitoxin system RelE/ParE family toxin [Cyanobacteria bacterium J06581_3]